MDRQRPATATAPLGRFGDSWQNFSRITTVRVIVQAAMFAFFLVLVLLTTFAQLDRLPGLRHWLSKFLQVDPLLAIGTALGTRAVYRGLLWSLIVLIPTLFLGRFFCNWICPFGSLHHLVGWLFRRPQAAPAANSYRSAQRAKYYILVGLLAAAALGALQVGLLDPLCLLHRSLTAAVAPALNLAAPRLFGDLRFQRGAWLIGFVLFGLLAANLVYPRFFCRVLCPLGALLGLLSRLAWWRIERDPLRCQGCAQCRLHCEGACDPDGRLRAAECLVCFNCIEDCPQGALRFALFPPRERELTGPDASRRKLLFAGLSGLLFFPLARVSGRSAPDFASRLIRPPGALEELEFLKRCAKCGQCARVCPTNVIQPDWFTGGLEGLWSPLLNFRLGYCRLHCTACGQLCPTGAIRRIPVEQKLGLGRFAHAGPIRLGTAHIDPGRCLPHGKSVPCVVCEEVCPTSPKAIYGQTVLRPRRDGREVELRLPHVDIDLCIGCGICENKCPVVGDRRAIYVTAEGETRSRDYPQAYRNRAFRLPSD